MATFLKQKKRGRAVRNMHDCTVESLRAFGNTRKELGLTPKQEEFAKHVASGLTQKEAAKKAGYKGRVVARGWMLMSDRYYPKVVNRVREIKEELSERYEVTFENHVQKMAEIRDAALVKGNFTAAVAAEKSRGQVAGLYISRQEIMVGKIDQMSRDEVMAEIKRIQSEFPLLLGADSSNTILNGVFTESFENAAILNADDGSEDVDLSEEDDGEDGDMDKD